MPLIFTWDKKKAASNLRKHRIAFDEAVTIFGDPLLRTVADLRHSASEERFLSVGRTGRKRLVLVAHSESEGGNTIRIISARKASAKEAKIYEQGEDF
jgi:uncharacterized DUF497 family protein